MRLNIVLAHPQIPQNTGNAARTCAATGAGLHLIKPMGFALDDSKMKRAGLDYWDKLNVKVYDGFADFFVRTSSGESGISGEYHFFETASATGEGRVYSDVLYKDNAYLIFGSEDVGLPKEIIRDYRGQFVQIPMRAGLRSLNLSNSAAIGVYEVLRQWGFPKLDM
ncbi:MAG: tRNA (cytidine(34)-2'-O)-methyltransferase [Oscillospiraceae bacterium]|nr:tRNA (cytidine(34)-2'-O)-methyltransferase [Oscillospiraceae bacterium]